MASENDTLYDIGRSKDALGYVLLTQRVEFLTHFDDNHTV
jgi:hypothetical protein